MAVRHGYGKIAGTDALVFAYDTGDTRNSYKGEPTTNLTTDTPSGNGWAGAFTVVDSATKTYTIESRQNNAATTSAWRTHYWSVSSYIGSYVTISADVEFVSETDCTFRDLSMGQGNTGSYPYHIAGSDVADRVQITTKPTSKVHITWSGVINSTGIVGFTQWINNVTANGANSILQISNVQIEAKAHETPFVNGTRSATQGLLDLTGNSTIDLSNVSFDSNAQMTFDGTNDTVTAVFTGFNSAYYSLEWIINPDTNTNYNQTMGLGNSTLVDWGTFLVHSSSTGGLYCGTDVATRFTPTNLPAIYSNGQYVHCTFTFNNGSTAFYKNGALVASKSMNLSAQSTFNRIFMSTSLDGYLPVAKVYNRALTAAEVRNNYNQYKGRFNI